MYIENVEIWFTLVLKSHEKAGKMTDPADNQLLKISKEDTISMPEEKSEILDFFDGTSVFITGATGFLGRLILEKLLRTCKGIKRIYILIRAKKGKSVQQRYEELFDVVVSRFFFVANVRKFLEIYIYRYTMG